MPKSYNVVPDKSSGDPFTEAMWDDSIKTNINNLRVPPMLTVQRTTSTAAYTSGAAITWEAVDGSLNTDGMWTSGSTITVQTAGVYHITLTGRIAASAGMFVCAPQITIGGTNYFQHYSALYSSNTVCQFHVSGVAAIAASTSVTGSVPIDAPGGTTYTIYGTPSGQTLAARMSLVWLGQVS